MATFFLAPELLRKYVKYKFTLRLYPHLTKVREISIKIAVKVASEAYRCKILNDQTFVQTC